MFCTRWFLLLLFIGSNYGRNTTENEDGCASNYFPCSNKIGGNLVLIIFYGLTLGVGAKFIADGAELLLDLGLPAAIIGGVVLPIFGAVPDSFMILVSGMGERHVAEEQLSVGMGTLAGSTILLLTIAWGISLIVGRVDIQVDANGRKYTTDKQCTGFHLTDQGIEPNIDVRTVSIVMLITSLPYLIVQSADWYFGASLLKERQPTYVKTAALFTMILAGIGFIVYTVMQVIEASKGKNPKMLRHEKLTRQKAVANAAKVLMMGALKKQQRENYFNNGTTTEADTEATVGRAYFGVWKMHAAAKKLDVGVPDEETDASKEQQELISKEDDINAEQPKWKIALNSISQLAFGVGLVVTFSDPMCEALSSITNNKNPQYLPIGAFYVSFVITPLCSNASELVSSIMFAMKKEKENISVTFSQLYGAAVMNNTLCLCVFCALVYFRDLHWIFSAEVTVILLCELALGVTAIIYSRLYYLYLAIPVSCGYIASLLLVFILEKVFGWG